MIKPVRLQLSRRARFRLQDASRAINGLEAVSVARPHRYGNPFKLGNSYKPLGKRKAVKIETLADAVEVYRNNAMHPTGGWPFREQVNNELRGKNLACWCKIGEACHADVLLEIANR